MEARQSREMARDLAALTGGVSLVDTNDPLGGIDRVMQDASTHYVLAYEPSAPLKANEYRQHRRQGEATGRARARPSRLPGRGRSAAAAAEGPGQPVAAACGRLLSGVLPEDGLPMRVEAVPVARTGKNITMAVIVEIDGTRVGQRTADGILELEQGLLTVNESGKAANGTRRLLTLRPTDAQWAVLAASSLRSVWAVDLPPGRHQLRVAALQSGSGRGGSVYLDIIVPKEPHWPAGLLVASRFLSMMPTPFIDPRLVWLDSLGADHHACVPERRRAVGDGPTRFGTGDRAGTPPAA